MRRFAEFVGCYIGLGAVHEAAHVLTYVLLYSNEERLDAWRVVWDNTVRVWFRHVRLEKRSCKKNEILTIRREKLVRHAGWICSVLIAWFMWVQRLENELVVAAVLTAIEALWTDLFQIKSKSDILHCGNFGVILFNKFSQTGEYAFDLLEKMVEVTMIRGAQAGGIVTFLEDRFGPKGAVFGTRTRVVNTKRADLAVSLRRRAERVEWLASRIHNKLSIDHGRTRIYMGHTRFATTSKASHNGTHPHCWSPSLRLDTYYRIRKLATGATVVPSEPLRNIKCETFVTHNGDLDAYNVNGTWLDLMSIQSFLHKATGQPKPSEVDSVCIAGIMELLRSQGSWALSARYAFLYGIFRLDHDFMDVPNLQLFAKIGKFFEKAYVNDRKNMHEEKLEESSHSSLMDASKHSTWSVIDRDHNDPGSEVRRAGVAEEAVALLLAEYDTPNSVVGALLKQIVRTTAASDEEELTGFHEEDEDDMEASRAFSLKRSITQKFARCCVDAFLDNDLLYATRIFLTHARGSFGLVVANSLDANRQIVMAARAQPMSIAFYPRAGLVAYGSDLNAVKIPLGRQPKVGIEASKQRQVNFARTDSKLRWTRPKSFVAQKMNLGNGDGAQLGPHDDWFLNSQDFGFDVDEEAVRFDLDDLAGEVVLMDWGAKDGTLPSSSRVNSKLRTEYFCRGVVSLTVDSESALTEIDTSRHLLYSQKRAKVPRIHRRLLPLEHNNLVLPVPKPDKDQVGRDLLDIPHIVEKVRRDWRSCNSINRLTFWTLSRAFKSRVRARAKTNLTINSARSPVDILVTGCEVSLWLGEQFASDLAMLFPKLAVKSVSANKLMGAYLNQRLPATGHNDPTSWDLRDAIVIIISHSGSTFPSLAVANLLQTSTDSVFVVTSDWDTQIGRAVRRMQSDMFESRIFSTQVGFRAAEPSTVTVAATHQLLTQILLQLSLIVVSTRDLRIATGITANDFTLAQVERCSEESVKVLEDIVGLKCDQKIHESDLNRELRNIGKYWAGHVIEAPIAWFFTALFICATVIPGIFVVHTLIARSPESGSSLSYVSRLGDALLYIWFPEIFVAFLRLVQGRPLLHRMGTRNIVIADVPWVAQCVEAFASKCFARAYAISTANFYAANPSDHFVHRFTHRVARGTIIACGRPDGELEALTSAEAAVCLAINQAASIQSLGATAETLTIGHTPHKLALSSHAVFLPRHRPKFLCERLLSMSSRKRRMMRPEAESEGSIRPAFGQRSGVMNLMSTPRSYGKNLKIRRNTSFGTARSIASKRHHDDDCSCGSISIEYGNLRHSSFNSSGPTADFENYKNRKAARKHSNEILSPKSIERRRLAAELIKPRVSAVVARHRQIDAVFKEITGDTNDDVLVDFEQVKKAYEILGSTLDDQSIRLLYDDVADPKEQEGKISKKQFTRLVEENSMEILLQLGSISKYVAPASNVEPSKEAFFGETSISKFGKFIDDLTIAESQTPAMLLYESRLASLQRAVAFFVIFHRMGHVVAQFWHAISLGYFGYSVDRTQSILRVASTASPVSGAEVREQMKAMNFQRQHIWIKDLLSHAMRSFVFNRRARTKFDTD